MRLFKHENDRAMAIGYLVCCEGMSEPEARIKALDHWIYDELFQKYNVKLCNAQGHNLKDESYGGPESGCMAGYCTRCGWSFKTILY